MTRSALFNSLTRSIAIALAMLVISFVAACFATSGGEEPEGTPEVTPATETPAPTVTPTVEPSPEPPLTPENLLAELRSLGIESEPLEEGSYMPFSEMNGFVRREAVTGQSESGDESVSIFEFTGPGEALLAATRIDMYGDGYSMPTRDGGWGGGSGGYAFTRPRNYFLSGNLIAEHFGESAEVSAVLEEMMGKPFAGTSLWGQEITDEERLPGYADLWQEQVVEAEFVGAELVSESEDGLRYRIRFRANLVHSFACSGESFFDMETVDNEVRITIAQRTVNTDVVQMSEPCDMDWEWSETHNYARGLTRGQTYYVLVNGERLGGFVTE